MGARGSPRSQGTVLSVQVLAARGLRAADRSGTSDPYCVVSCGVGPEFRTPVVPKTLQPEWVPAASFPFFGPLIDDVSVVRLSVYDRDTLRDDLLGTVEVPCEALWGRGPVAEPLQGWYPLVFDAMPAGHVLVSLLVTGPGALFRRKEPIVVTVSELQGRHLMVSLYVEVMLALGCRYGSACESGHEAHLQ